MTNIIGGKRAEGKKLTNLTGGDPWAEAPFYGVGEGSEFVTSWPVGTMIAGTFHGIRTANKKGPEAKQREYGVFKSIDGELLRVFTPGQLVYLLSKIDIGSYVEMTYKGMEYVEKLEREVHSFDVQAENSIN